MSERASYPIGTPGKKWGAAERDQWLARQRIRRSYADEVLAKIETLEDRFDIAQYGALSHNPERYPLFVLKSRNWIKENPNVLITGGVHGYETSGVQGALRFLQTAAEEFAAHFNLLAAPCISPWGYETINRWNPGAIDPNRSFYADSPSEEAAAIMSYLEAHPVDLLAHFDLHETTDSDNEEFRPALAARDGVEHEKWHTPDGFYTVDDSAHPQPGFQAAVIASVEKVTHIALPDEDGNIIGEKMQQPGVINYDAGPLGLCMGLSAARFVTTTEVYPDSPRVDDENCTLAQVAAVVGGLEYLLRHP